MKKTLKLVLLTVLALALTVCAFTACNQKVATGIELKDAKTEFVVGDEFTYDGIKVTVVYDDGTTEAATDFKVDSSAVKKDTAGAYTVKVTVTVGDKTLEKTYTVNYAAAPHVHEYGTLVAEVAATCETAGTKAHYQCSGCQKYFDADKKEVTQESLVIAAKGHTYGDLIEEVAASCKATGTQAHYKCSDCNKLFNASKQKVTADSLVIAITDHNYGTLVAKKEATCEVAGKNAYYECATCHKIFDENKAETTAEALVIAAKGHTYGEIIPAVAATCETAGTKEHYECSACHKFFDADKHEVTQASLEIAATGHVYGTLVPAVAATCEDAGKNAYYECSACHKLFDENKAATTAEALVIAAKGHEYGTLVAKQEATCEEAGKNAYYECAACHKIFDENKAETTAEALVIAAKGHTYGELIAEVAATCAKTGTKAHYECSVCNKLFNEEKAETTAEALTIAINPENHTYGELIAKTVSTCAVKGEEAHYECACGKYFTAEKAETTLEAIQSPIDESNHDYGALIEEKAPTCVKEGAKAHYECACGKLFDAEKAETTAEALAIATIDHNYQGIDQKCSMCGALDYASFEDVIKQGSGKTFKVVGKVVAIYGGNPYQGIFIANGEFGLQVYKTSNAMAEGIAVGDIVEVVGKYAWYGTNRTVEIDVSGSGSLKKLEAAPDHGYTAPVDYAFDAATWATITKSSTAADNIYTNRPITVTGVVKEGVTGGRQFVITVNDVDVIVFYKGDSNITAEIKQAISLVAVGKTVTVTGVVGSYNGTTQIVAPVVVDVQLTQEEKDALALAEAIEGLEGAYLTEKTELSTKATWESKSEAVVITFDEATGKYTIAITAGEEEITVVLTATVGDKHQDVTMKIKAKTSGEDPEPTKSYVKLTAVPTDWTATTYIIVYEDGKGNAYVFNGVDASGNSVKTTYAENVIAYDDNVAACEVSIDANCNIKLLGGANKDKYIIAVKSSNKISFSATASTKMSITVASTGIATIKDDQAPFQYNNGTSNGLWFRYFGKKNGGQQSVCIYQLVEA